MKIALANLSCASKKKPARSKGAGFVFCFLSMFFLFGLLISTAAAATEWKISPSNPNLGDTLKITGKAAPGEKLRAEVSFEKGLSVSKGKYSYLLEDIKIPSGDENQFSVTVNGVKNLHIGVKKLIWFHLHAEGSNGVASISHGHVPPFTYDILIDGDALSQKSCILLKVTAAQTLTADSKGKFEFSYDTSSMPAGTYTIKIGDSKQTIELQPKGHKKLGAAFSAAPASGKVPLKVTFTDKSKGEPASWLWDFGDGACSTEKNPVHTYKKAGKYTVILIVSSPEGTACTTQEINVLKSNTDDGSTNPPSADKSKPEIRITNSKYDHLKPVIWGDNVVWTGERKAGLSNLYMYNLSTNKETRITDSESAEPDIYGDSIVWTDFRNENPDIYMYNASAKEETRITENEFDQLNPAISEDTVVWQDNRSGNWDIWMYNISTRDETQITDNESDQLDPAIYRDTVVWQDNRSGNWDIWMYNLSTGEETQITENESDQLDPAIYRDTVVWQDSRSGNWDIWMYNLSTGEETQITDNEFNQTCPDIYRDRVVWQEESDGGEDIYMYEISTGAETQITSKGVASQPSVYEGNIVWVDGRNKNSDIYMMNLANLQADFSASSKSGKAPLKVIFTDMSSGSPTSWKWYFGDGTYSTKQNPVHTYEKAGKYTVSLNVENSEGTDTETKPAYIIVSKGK